MTTLTPVGRRHMAIAVTTVVALVACRVDRLTNTPAGIDAISPAVTDVRDSALVGNPSPHTAGIALAGPLGTPLDWSARVATPVPWLTVDATGHAPAGQDTLHLRLGAGSLPVGLYIDTVFVQAAGGPDTAIGVTFDVLPCPGSGVTLATAVHDTLTSRDCRPPEPGGFAKVFYLRAAAPESVTVSVDAAGFAPYLTLADSAAPDPPLGTAACPGGSTPCLANVPLPHAGTYRLSVAAVDTAQTGPFTLLVRAPLTPEPPTALAQLKSDGATVLAPGATTADSALIFRAGTNADPGDSVRLEVELRAADSALTQEATLLGPYAPAGTITATARGLADGAYHWAARVTDRGGRASAWVPFGSGAADFTLWTPATALGFSQEPGTATAGTHLSPVPTVRALKPSGAVDTAFNGTITLQLSGAPAGTSLNGTTTRTAVHGVAAFDDLSVNRAGTGYALVAAASGMAPATSAAFDITPAAASHLAFATQPPDVAAGDAMTPAPAVSVRDAFDNIVTSYAGQVTVALQGGAGGATLSGTVSRNAVNGVAAFADLSVDRAASGYTLSAAAAGLTVVTSASFAVAPGAAATLVYIQQPSNVAAGQPITPAVEVSVRDRFNNVVTTYSTTVTVTLGNDPNLGLSTLSGTRSVTPTAGVARFDDLRIDLPGNGFTLSTKSGALPAAASDPFDVNL